MRKLVLVVAILALPGLAFASKLDVQSGGASAITLPLNSAGPIVIDVMLTDTIAGAIDGALYNIHANNGAADALFDITTYANGNLFLAGDYLMGVAAGGNVPPFNMAAVPSSEGYAKTSGALLDGASGTLATYTIQPVAPLAAGVYVISVTYDPDGYNGVSAGGSIFGFDPASVPLTINVLPEPASALLLLGAIPFLRRRR